RDASANHWFISYVMNDSGAVNSDLEVWFSNHPGYNYAYLAYATDNGANSIVRPRGSVTASRIWVSANRWVADVSGFKRQVMTRRFDYAATKDPTSSSVEISATSGSCGADPSCRPGDKSGLT